jgi:hypothetical protein
MRNSTLPVEHLPKFLAYLTKRGVPIRTTQEPTAMVQVLSPSSGYRPINPERDGLHTVDPKLQGYLTDFTRLHKRGLLP